MVRVPLEFLFSFLNITFFIIRFTYVVLEVDTLRCKAIEHTRRSQGKDIFFRQS